MDSCRRNSKGGYLATALSDCDAAGPLAYTSYAMFGLAAAGAVVDTVLLLRGGRSSSSSTNDDTSVSWLWLPGGGGLAARGRF
jgi:hypothetical protein